MVKRKASNPIKAVKEKSGARKKGGSKSKNWLFTFKGYVLMALVFIFLLFAFPFTRNASFNAIDQCLVWMGLGDKFQFNSAEIKLPRKFKVHGIDVSHHNGKIVWDEVEKIELRGSEPLSFVFIKATEGKDHLDTRYIFNWREAKETMLLRGAYHYYHPTVDPLKQARWFIRNVHLEEGDLPPVIDVEVRGKDPLPLYRNNVLAMAKALQSEYGVKPIIYTSHDYFNNYFDTKEFKGYKFWIARYDFHQKVENESSWYFWQHSEKGRVSGIRGKVDYNVFRGSLRELSRLCVQ